MTLKRIQKSKLRAKIIRKGLFTQLIYKSKQVEKENKLFRTVIDYALYDITDTKEELRKEIISWLHPNNKDFILVCFCAGLKPLNVYNMFLFLLRSFFPQYLEELYCYQESNGGIVEFSPELTLLSSDEINAYLNQ